MSACAVGVNATSIFLYVLPAIESECVKLESTSAAVDVASPVIVTVSAFSLKILSRVSFVWPSDTAPKFTVEGTTSPPPLAVPPDCGAVEVLQLLTRTAKMTGVTKRNDRNENWRIVDVTNVKTFSVQ